ncbi:MAG: flavodoxin family protein [Desulfobacterales bacterium]|nr:flavodoxin family protein [Desulfobacterales bacterium]
MKKILGIVSSPRKLGNCELVIKEISRQIDVPHELSLLRLSDFSILPCKGCYTCLFKQQRCPLKDDLNTIIDALVEADAVILSAPTYLLDANAMLKVVIDRGLAFYAAADGLWGTPAIGVGVAGIEGKEGATVLGLQRFLSMFMADKKMCTMVYGALPGEVLLNEKNKAVIGDLAAALFRTAPEPKEPCCPLCGGDTFRFLGDNRVRCMLCSNAGTVDGATGTLVFHIEKSGHDLFLTDRDALSHRDWLREMKARFKEIKGDIAAITSEYKDDGTWIRPGKSDDA